MIKKLTESEQNKRKENLKFEYSAKGIKTCEIKLPICMYNNFLAFAHKEKRWKYIKRPKDLWTFKETILACQPCHDILEPNKNLTDAYFKKLRNNG